MSYKTKSTYRPQPDGTEIVNVPPGWTDAVAELVAEPDETPSRLGDSFARRLLRVDREERR